MSKKCTPLWREAHFEVKMYKTPHFRTTFERSDAILRGRRKGLCTLSKMSKSWGFCSSFKNDGRHGTFEENLERCISRGMRSTRDMFIRDVRRSGWSGKIAKRIGTRAWALHSTFHFWRKSRRIVSFWCCQLRILRKSHRLVSFLMLSSSKIEEASQNCFVFDVVKFENWESGRIASFSSLQQDRQTDRQTDRQIDR